VACRGGDVCQQIEGLSKDRVIHVLNYERHQRVISFTNHNLHKTLIMEVCILTLSIQKKIVAFYVTTTLVHFQ
jgi:hypothetical protein